MKKDDIFYLRKAIEVSVKSREHGNTPFGAVLVNKEGEIVLEQENIELTEHICTGHAETQLVRKAGLVFSKDELKDFTLYTTCEPCCMCAGAIYWSGISCVVYALSEKDLLFQTGNDERNPTLSLSCRDVFKTGQKQIQVRGPFLELKEEVLKAHEGYWKNNAC